MLLMFYLFYNTDDLQYDIYFNDNNILLAPKSKNFIKYYISKLNEDGTFYYFDKKKIEKTIKENNIEI